MGSVTSEEQDQLRTNHVVRHELARKLCRDAAVKFMRQDAILALEAARDDFASRERGNPMNFSRADIADFYIDQLERRAKSKELARIEHEAIIAGLRERGYQGAGAGEASTALVKALHDLSKRIGKGSIHVRTTGAAVLRKRDYTFLIPHVEEQLMSWVPRDQ
jgi:hypothetical protein